MAALVEIGLTGGIAAGKSEVLRCLAEAGCHTLDLDRVAHAVMAPGGSAYGAVVDAFGRGVLDDSGAIDRAELGRVVFSDEAARRRLNALVHPRIRDEERRQARELEVGPGGVLVVDAALLVETGTHLRFDRLVVVDVTPAEQMRRLQARDGLDEADARRRLEAQMPVAEKRRHAHVVIDNSGDLGETRRAARRLGAELLNLPGDLPRPAPADPARVEAMLASGPTGGPLPPAAFVGSIATHGHPELSELAGRLRPGSRDPWYAGAAGAPEAALALAAPLAVWVLAERGEDRDRLAGAAFSLGRLFGLGAAEAAGLVVTALAALAGAARGLAEAWDRDGEAWQGVAERWCGCRAAPPEALRAALAHPGDPAAARGAAATGPSGATAAALVALATGRGDGEVGEAERRAAAALRPRR